jgi:regulator of cell morphogenesis and NO signaling
MTIESLSALLEQEHREIDDGLAAFLTDPASEGQRLSRAMTALRRHIYLEEELLFPPLRDVGLVAPVFVMLREHAQIWETLDAIDELLAGDDPDSGLAVDRCRQLVELLDSHNLKEERILYPPADQVLTEAARSRLRAFLESGELPEGWVVAGLRT